MKHKPIQLILVLLIAAMAWQSLGQAKGAAIPTGVGIDSVSLSPEKNLLRPRARGERDSMDGQTLELAKEIILQVRERCVVVGRCAIHSVYLARRLTEQGFKVRVMYNKRCPHWWVEDIAEDGYIWDAFPEGVGDGWIAKARSLGDARFIFIRKNSDVAKNLYRGEEDKKLTEQAQLTANNEEFYKDEVRKLGELSQGKFPMITVREMDINTDEPIKGFRRQLIWAREKLTAIQLGKIKHERDIRWSVSKSVMSQI